MFKPSIMYNYYPSFSLRILIILLIYSLHTLPAYAGGLSALSAIGDSLSKSVDVWAESERQKELMQQQHDLEMQRIQYEQTEARRRQEESQRQKQIESQRQFIENQKRQLEEIERKRSELVTGTGFFINPNGYVVTNYHVIEDKSEIAVRDFGGKFHRAEVILKDEARDLALLKIDGRYQSLKILNSDSVTKGQRVITVGYPQIAIQGNESKVTDGIISSFSGIRNDTQWFQISVPIQGGNSGGSLVTETGAVVGIVVATANVAKFYKLTGNIPQNINYAIKSIVLIDFLKEARIANIAFGKGISPIDSVDRSTVLIMAKNAPIDVVFEASVEQRNREQSESARVAREESRRRSEEMAENKKQISFQKNDEMEKRREEKTAELEKLKVARADERVRQIAIKKNADIEKVFPNWQEIARSNIFTYWLQQMPNEISQKFISDKSSDLIATLKLFEKDKVSITEKYESQKSKLKSDNVKNVLASTNKLELQKIALSEKIYIGTIVEINQKYGFAVALIDRSLQLNENLAFQSNGVEVFAHPEKQSGNRLSLTLKDNELLVKFIGSKIYITK